MRCLLNSIAHCQPLSQDNGVFFQKEPFPVVKSRHGNQPYGAIGDKNKGIDIGKILFQRSNEQII